MSSARVRRGSHSNRGSATLNIIDRKLVAKSSRVVGIDERHPHAVSVGCGGERRQFRDESHDLLHAVISVVDVFRLGIERRQCCDRRHQHAHRVRVVVETFEKSLADVLVDVGVIRDLVHPRVVLLGRRQLAVDQQIRDLEIRRLLGQLLDRIAAVAQDALFTVELGDRRRSRGSGAEAGIGEPDAWQQFGPRAANRRPRLRSESRSTRHCGYR